MQKEICGERLNPVGDRCNLPAGHPPEQQHEWSGDRYYAPGGEHDRALEKLAKLGERYSEGPQPMSKPKHRKLEPVVSSPQPSMLTAYGRLRAIVSYQGTTDPERKLVSRRDLATVLENYARLLTHYTNTIDCPEHGRACQDAHCSVREQAAREVTYDPFVK